MRNKDRKLNTFPLPPPFTGPTHRPSPASPHLMSVPTARPAVLYCLHFSSVGFGAFCLFSHIFGVVWRELGRARDPLCPAPAAPHGSLRIPSRPLTAPSRPLRIPSRPLLRNPSRPLRIPSQPLMAPSRPLHSLGRRRQNQNKLPQISHNAEQDKPKYLGHWFLKIEFRWCF